MTEILGILDDAWNGKKAGADAEEYDKLMQVILNVRQTCREKKLWDVADAIRDELGTLGIVIEDSPQGARWKKREL